VKKSLATFFLFLFLFSFSPVASAESPTVCINKVTGQNMTNQNRQPNATTVINNNNTSTSNPIDYNKLGEVIIGGMKRVNITPTLQQDGPNSYFVGQKLG
jgi:hypothetical protein